MRDEETESLWDHITGECFEGPLEGQRMEFWPIHMTNVAAELERDADAVLLKSDYRSIKASFMKTVLSRKIGTQKEGTVLMPPFRNSMSSQIDPRLPEGEQGLGVMDDDFGGKFYPVKTLREGAITDEWRGRQITVKLGATDKIPVARHVDDGTLPMQLLTRWYGFAFTCPGCAIYGVEDENAA